jgi:aspartokinase
MAKIVVKFGGTSVGSVERIKSVAKILKKKLLKAIKLLQWYLLWQVRQMS